MRTETVPVDLAEAARALESAVNHPTAELLQRLSSRSGILLEKLSEPMAIRCQQALSVHGISTMMVPAASIIEPPSPLIATSAIIEEEWISYRSANEQGVIPWSEVIWGDLIDVQFTTHTQDENWSVGGGAGGKRLKRNMVQRMETRKKQRLDVVSYEPWLLLRIDPDVFDWHSTGLVVQSNGRQNMLALAIAIGSRCAGAAFGPGMSWISDASSPPDDYRAKSPEYYDQYLRWQLTLRFLEDRPAE